MKVKLLASGSDGNCCYIESGETRALLDVGISRENIRSVMKGIQAPISGLTSVILTHEHGDHSKGLKSVLSGDVKLGCYMTSGTLNAKKVSSQLKGLRNPVSTITPGCSFSVGGLSFVPFLVMHDAAEPVGFFVIEECSGSTMVFTTDLRTVPREIRKTIGKANLVVVECNHDSLWLARCGYEEFLQRRVANNHTNNADVSDFLAESMTPSVKHVVLAHISSDANSTDTVMDECQYGVDRSGCNASVEAVRPGGESCLYVI